MLNCSDKGGGDGLRNGCSDACSVINVGGVGSVGGVCGVGGCVDDVGDIGGCGGGGVGDIRGSVDGVKCGGVCGGLGGDVCDDCGAWTARDGGCVGCWRRRGSTLRMPLVTGGNGGVTCWLDDMRRSSSRR